MADGDAVVTPEKRKNADLPVRLASAVVMIAVAAGALWLGGRWFDWFAAIVALATFWEFARLITKLNAGNGARLGWTAFAVLYVGAAYFALVSLPIGVVVGVIAVVIATDTGAYFSGRTFGGPKIAPSISPSKTWAGLIGGSIAAGLVSAGFFLSNMGEIRFSVMLVVSFLIGVLLAVLAQAGDFFQSWFKRRAGAKDSSNIIPGHGGIFDRTDGMLPVAVAAWLLWMVHPA